MALTVKKVEQKNSPGRYGDGKGLYLQVTKAGAKSWVMRYERGGRERMMGLGPLHAFSLDEARERARLARQKLADGIDPLSDREAERTAQSIVAARRITFKDAANQYYELHRTQWKNRKHAAQFLSTLETYAYPQVGEMSVADIDTDHVLKVIEPIWLTKTETANRVRGRIESVLAWATVRKYRAGDNPARWQGHLREALPPRGRVAKVRNHPALPYGDIGPFMAELRQREGIAARALELTILSAARTGEVIGAQWSEIDLENGIWTVPAERMKASKEHRVPLSERALILLKALPREGEAVFPGSKKDATISNMSMAAVLKRMNVTSSLATVHGFRSTFRDWAAEQTAYPSDVVEMALAHSIKSKTEAAYRRGDLFAKRQRLMADWEAYVAKVPGEAENVTPIREAV